LAKWLANQVNDQSKAEILQVLPDLPLHKIVRLEGLIPTIDALALHQAMFSQGGVAATSAQEVPANRIFLNGDFWTVTFGGQTRQLKNTKGMQLIALLIRNQGRSCHVLQLEQDLNPAPSLTATQGYLAGMTEDQLDELNLSISLGATGFEIFDAQAIASIRVTLNRLKDRIKDAKELGKVKTQAKLEEERDRILHELNAGLGMAGQPRKSDDAMEKSRKRVQLAIASEIERLNATFPDFAKHLKWLTTGTECSYQPHPPHDWTF
jgi:hypothetical protein